MKVLFVQCVLGALLILSTFTVVGILHASFFVAGVAGCVLLGILWFAYLVWQSQHPDWWAPWDEGLPQTTRMSNAFVPVLLTFLFLLVLAPTFAEARRKNLARREQKSLTSP